MSTLSDYLDALDDLAPGEHPVDETELNNRKTKAVNKALEIHSRHKPRIIVEDIAGDGGNEYALSSLGYWENVFSWLIHVEYPADEGNHPGVLSRDSWALYEKPTGPVLLFLDMTPDTGRSIRITYTGRHFINDSSCSVAASDEEAVQSLAACLYCKMLSATYALDQDGTITADSVDQNGRSRKYLELAKTYCSEYFDHMGIREGKPKPVSLIQDQDVIYPWGVDRLTHPKKWR